MSFSVITGGAGFVGSNLAERLIHSGEKVRVLDNFSTGKKEFLEGLDVDLIEIDLFNIDQVKLRSLLRGAKTVYHLSANADVRFGWDFPRRDLEQNLLVTLNLLEASSQESVKDFIFSSTGSVYGEASTVPTGEFAEFPTQTSLYGASKVSSEAFIAAYATSGKFRATVFRFVSVLGRRYTHGHVIDFYRQLMKDPNHLHILGDGYQQKSYMNVRDCVHGVHFLRSNKSFDVFNLGTKGYCTVRESAGWIASELGLDPHMTFEGGKRGWIGDNPLIWLDAQKAFDAGWTTSSSIEESVRETIAWIRENHGLLEKENSREQ